MSMTDPIADMITRIRNGITAKKEMIQIPASNSKREILRVLREEGFILDYEFAEDNKQGMFHVRLKYGPQNQRIINGIERVSKSGRRIYKNASDITRFRGGLGFSIVSTNKGVMTDRDSIREGIGGEILVNVW